MCHGQSVACLVMWCQHRVEVQPSHSGATRSVKECSWRFLHRQKTEKLQAVGKVYLKCLANLLEALWSGSPTQPFRCNQKCWRVLLKIPSQAENWEASRCWQSVFEVFGQSSRSFVKRKSNPAIQVQPEVLKSVAEDSFAGGKLGSFKLLAKYIWSVRPIFVKLCEQFSKLYEELAYGWPW